MQLPVGLASPSALTIYGSAPDMREVLFVAVSQSGRSPDLVDSLTVARARGATSVAVTNDLDSPLAHAAEIAVDIRADAERAVAATKTYTAELLALCLLFGVVVGRGYSYATAREAALKLMETSYLSAQAFSGADLLHGPLAMIDESVPVIAISSPGLGGEAMAPVLERLTALGAHILRVGVGVGVELPIAADGIAEHLLPILEILPLQRLARRVALDRGIDPDHPRGLSKVTQTV